MNYDTIIVGAGFAGSILAERLATKKDKKILVIEKRDHIGGNCADYVNENGIIVQRYGPHSFHSRDKGVIDYLGKFTDWTPFQLRVLSYIDGKNVPIPINFDSMHQLLPKSLAKRIEKKLLNSFEYGIKLPIFQLKKKAKELEDEDLLFYADFVFKKAFLNYTRKQWEEEPENLLNVLERVPINLSRDDRYHSSEYRCMPEKGYNHIFKQMLSHRYIDVRLNTDYKDIIDIDLDTGKIKLDGEEWNGLFIYTGAIDYFFNFSKEKLPFRSLTFKFKELDKEWFQESAVINYPNDHLYTRITEFKHFTKLYSPPINKTVIAYEYPARLEDTNEPYYPIPKKECQKQYKKYLKLADKFKDVGKGVNNDFQFIGRLAEYRYYDMWQIVKRALDLYEELEKKL
ncbi:MAG: UDP-galactopyranose mutase [archaeon]|nr:UDP-galactopyranose mutase [archaeon]